MIFFGDARFTPGADYAPHLEDEKRAVNDMREQGFIIQLFRRLDDTGALLILEDDSPESATDRLNTLPFVRLGLMTIPVTEIEQL